MKLLAFTDLHLSLTNFAKMEKLAHKEKPDFIVCCGDISIFEQNLDFIIKKLASLKCRVLAINGNHEDEVLMSRLCSRYPNINFIHRKSYVYGNYQFFGYGGDGFSYIDEDFEHLAKSFRRFAKKETKKILVTHAPPFGTKMDILYDNEHHGNKSIRNFINELKPELALCGHFHENFRVQQKIGKTLFVNPGPAGMIVKV